MFVKRLGATAALAVCIGCASQSSVLVSGAQPAQQVVKTQRFFLWGLIASDTTWDPRAQCPNGISKVDMNNFISLMGIYASYSIRAWCSSGAPMGAPSAYGRGASIIVVPQ